MIRRNDFRRIERRLIVIPALAGMFLCMLSLPAQAQNDAGFFSSYYLEQLCRSDEDGQETIKGGHTACQAYIAGIIDYHNLLRSMGTQPIIDICVPNNTPMKRLQDIVWVFLAKNKQHEEFIAAPAVTLALYDYYACQPKKTKTRRKHKG